MKNRFLISIICSFLFVIFIEYFYFINFSKYTFRNYKIINKYWLNLLIYEIIIFIILFLLSFVISLKKKIFKRLKFFLGLLFYLLIIFIKTRINKDYSLNFEGEIALIFSLNLILYIFSSSIISLNVVNY